MPIFRAMTATALAAATLTACGSDTDSETPENAREIQRSDYGNTWPLDVDGGTLSCDPPGGVYFTHDGTRYGVNGMAADGEEIRPIWTDNPEIPGTKIDIGPLIEDGLKLCDD